MVGYKEVNGKHYGVCYGCVFYKDGYNKPSIINDCTPSTIFVEDTPQIKLISALDISLMDGVLQELTEICDEQGSRIRPSSGESIRDFIKRLIYNQHRDE